MGSIISTVGNRAGKLVATLIQANYDTGPMLSVSVQVNALPTSVTTGDLPMGYKNVLFQLIPKDMTTGDVTIYGTLDRDTANGVLQGAEANWEPVVSPSSESNFAWSNPLTAVSGQRVLKSQDPWIAYRAVTSPDFDGTETQLLILAAP